MPIVGSWVARARAVAGTVLQSALFLSGLPLRPISILLLVAFGDVIMDVMLLVDSTRCSYVY